MMGYVRCPRRKSIASRLLAPGLRVPEEQQPHAELQQDRPTCRALRVAQINLFNSNLMNLMNYKGIGWKLQVLRPFSNVFEVSGIAGTAYFCMTMGIGIKEVGREISTIVRGQRDCFNLVGGHYIDLIRVLPGGGWQPGVLDSQLVGDVRWSS